MRRNANKIPRETAVERMSLMVAALTVAKYIILIR